MLAHSKFDIHITGDGSGWDRVLPLLPHVWSLRKSYFDFSSLESTRGFDYVAQHTCYPIVGIPDGVMYQHVTGNPSGSNTTTTDNCIAHAIITYYFLLLAGIRAHDRILERAEIHENTIISLYGDDSFDSLNSKFFTCFGETPEETKEGLHSVYDLAYNSFGVIVKATQFAYVTGKPIGLEFLGSTSIYANGYYYPRPRLGKMCTSITQAMSHKTHVQLVSTICSLYDLVAPIPDSDCQRVAASLERFASFALNQRLTDGVTLSDISRLTIVASRDRRPSLSLLTGYEVSH